ncbi:TrmB family transcriptional regulator [Archaeoglobus veneficus]|uniref:Transcriptional regulator, TrmB n=1 Tax=Archaeoglobus veneficus (strain DSM 11195 / SNP6) TaxID=693661 RepID=F2KMQ3_ARCVS|nr:helix-turn-helix domain-containing protein [Archaeoglobus veneficus]AEA46077.1 transcriptional regulator, TrmB [Archaeoglobus veneficus SNP6]
MEKLVDALRSFGLSEYEAKVLLSLIAEGELTAKQIAELSGVPRTSVYEVVKGLMAKGLVQAGGKPMKFRALPSDELMNLFSRRLKENIEFLKRELPSVESSKREEVVRIYTGEVAINALKESIEGARREIIVATTHFDDMMKELLKNAKCKVTVMAPNVSGSLRLDVESIEGVCHGMLLIDDRAAIYLQQGNNFWLMIGSGSFARFYQEFLETFIKQKVKKG